MSVPNPWPDIRPGERRGALAAFATLGSVTASHQLLETARDALFLADLPVARLPIVYLVIAAIGVAISQTRLGRGTAMRPLGLLLLVSAAVSAGFWFAVGRADGWSLYGLYVWTGVFGTLVTTRVWLLLGSLYSMTEAKRLFGFIGTGGILGAIAGASIARLLTEIAGIRHVVLASSIAMVASILGPWLLLRVSGAASAAPSALDARPMPLADCLRQVRGHAYTRRVGKLVLLSAVTFTLLDFAFKSVVAARVAPADLGEFFATLNVALGVGSLLAQLILVRWVLAAFGLTAALSILPILVVGGALAVAATGALAAAVVLKGADGSLRHSLHRTGTELLFVPMSDAVRSALKMFIDVVGHRGGQAAASLVILALVSVTPDAMRWVAAGTAVAAVAAIAVVWRVRRPYLELFRTTLAHESVRTRVDFPDLDMRSLESLVATLNSSNDDEVLAAVEMLADQRKDHLIPDLILYHPSRRVVLRALAIFARAGRTGFLPIADRLLSHDEPEIRAAALRARTAVERDDALLARAVDGDDSAIVRATALVWMTSSGDDGAARRRVDEIARTGDVEIQRALARAIRARPTPELSDVLIELARSHSRTVRKDAARAMAAVPNVAFVDELLPMLGQREVREAARTALVAIGPEALTRLDAALDDRSISPAVRHHLPRTIARFPAELAAPRLLERFGAEADQVVRFKLLRGLGRIRNEHPDLPLDDRLLERTTEDLLRAAFRLLSWEVSLQRELRDHPERRTMVAELLIDLLRDEHLAMRQWLFRLLGLRYPREHFEQIYRGLGSRNRRARASSRELLEGILRPPLRAPVLALVDDAPDTDRLAGARPLFHARALRYEQVLREILDDGDYATRCAAAYHAGELGIVELRDRVDVLARHPAVLVRDVGEHALHLLDAPRHEKITYAP